MSPGEFDARAFLASLTQRPGIYRMLDAQGRILYVGKARDLKKRVSTYFGSKAHQPKIRALMSRTARVEVTVTGTEQEALLLEYNLIKEHRPRFNVVLKDDKSYPWIHVSTDQEFPRFEFHRGPRRGGGRYFGPWPNAGAVREMLVELQRLFRIRQCSDAFFRNRSRPCLQHQIDRCSAPCVGLVTPEQYRRDVTDAMLFMEGRNEQVLAGLMARMETAAAAQDFERAALLRDQIALVRRVHGEQVVSSRGVADADVLAVHGDQRQYCVALILIRRGRVLGSRNFFVSAAPDTAHGEVLRAFIAQHYFHQPPPAEILVSDRVEDRAALEELLVTRSGHPVRIRSQVRSTRARWLAMAATNAQQGLALRRAAGASVREQMEQVAEALGLPGPPVRIECFDVSHTAGAETMAACVVFGTEGPVRSEYRRFNITGIEPANDYGAMAQAIRRRYARVQREAAPVPDLILVDGGRGQVDRARDTLQELAFAEVPLVGVAKGRDRRPGEEILHVAGRDTPLVLPPDSAALHLIQQVRDEAHRFAITGHRQRRARGARRSTLEDIPGLGPARRRALLRALGGLQGVRQAGVTDLSKVSGISRALAERIYGHLHGEAD